MAIVSGSGLYQGRTRSPNPVTDNGTNNSNFSNRRPVVLDVDLGHHLELENCRRMDRIKTWELEGVDSFLGLTPLRIDDGVG